MKAVEVLRKKLTPEQFEKLSEIGRTPGEYSLPDLQEKLGVSRDDGLFYMVALSELGTQLRIQIFHTCSPEPVLRVSIGGLPQQLCPACKTGTHKDLKYEFTLVLEKPFSMEG